MRTADPTRIHTLTSNNGSPLESSLMLGAFSPEMLFRGLFPRLHPAIYPALGLRLSQFPRNTGINLKAERSLESQCSSHHALPGSFCNASVFDSFGNPQCHSEQCEPNTRK
jgi:hypothetical protein